MFEQSRSLAGGIKGLRYAVLFFPDAGPRGSGTEDLPQRSPAGRPGWENDLRRSITARRCDARVTLSPEPPLLEFGMTDAIARLRAKDSVRILTSAPSSFSGCKSCGTCLLSRPFQSASSLAPHGPLSSRSNCSSRLCPALLSPHCGDVALRRPKQA